MSDSIDRRKFLKLTGAAGFGLGMLGRAESLSGSSLSDRALIGSESGSKTGAAGSTPPVAANTIGPYEVKIDWAAADLWKHSVADGLRHDSNAITLDDHILIEEDAPGLGAIQPDVWETIEQGVVLRKRLNIDHWPVREATLTMMVYPVEPEEPYRGAKLEFRINQNEPIVYEPGHVWTSVPIPPAHLKEGENLIEVTVQEPGTRFRTPVALHSNYQYGSLTRTPPAVQRSQRSRDGGSTWENGLGSSGTNRGEYPIRLKLRGYRKSGWLQTEVIDLARTEGVLHFPAEIESVRLGLNASRRGSGSRLAVYLRSGTAHRPESGEWTGWSRVTREDLSDEIQNRFIQLRIEAGSESADSTPLLRGLQLTSRVRPLPSAARNEIHLAEALNYPLVDTPRAFQHEDPAFPALQEFRKKYRLDEVVGDARTEMEKILRLRGWTAARWQWYLPDTERPSAVNWDARTILSPEEVDPGGFCLYYCIVFAQACQSFGIPARIATINYSVWGGHEVVEVWSRDYGKWIMIDPQFDTMFVAKENGEPQSVLELHNVFLDTYYPGGEVVDRDKWTFEERDRRSAHIDPENLPIRLEIGGHALFGKLDRDYVWWKVTEGPAPGYAGGYGFFNTAYVRWVPRSNWLSQPLPMPVTHGRTHWGWDGYLGWADSQTPETPEHRHFVRRESDIYERLGTVDFSAESVGNDDGVLLVHMATRTPGFDGYELRDNGRETTVRESAYRWKLAPGMNILEMQSVDKLGNKGPSSELRVSYIRSNQPAAVSES